MTQRPPMPPMSSAESLIITHSTYDAGQETIKQSIFATLKKSHKFQVINCKKKSCPNRGVMGKQ